MSNSCAPGCLCNCCSGVQQRTPRSVGNPQGRQQLRYRVGKYGDFFQSMIAELGTIQVSTADILSSEAMLGGALRGQVTPLAHLPNNPLAALTTRDLADPSIALLDAWSIVLDVMTFYSERIANEGYLRTATEFRSVLEMARLVGYQPRPGVSATTHLAYLLEKDNALTIRAGSKAQSVPESGQLPQTFETKYDLKAHYKWNDLTPRRARPQVFEPGQTTADKRVFFQGLNTQLKPNDVLLIVFDRSQGEPFRVKKVVPDNPSQRTMITLQDFSNVPLLGNEAAAQTEAERQFNVALLALQLSDEFAEVEDAIRRSISSVEIAIRKLIITTAVQINSLNLLINELDKTVGIGLVVPQEFRIPFEDFFVRLGMIADYLRIQVTAIVSSSIKLDFPVMKNTDLANVKRDLSSVKSMSPITLACRLDQCEKVLGSILASMVSLPDTDERALIQVEKAKAREYLGTLVRSLLRIIIDKFVRARQAGIPPDARLAEVALNALTQFKESFAPPLTPIDAIKLALREADSSLDSFLRKAHVFTPLKEFADSVSSASPDQIKTAAKSFLEKLAALEKFRDTLNDSASKFDDLVPLAKEADIRLMVLESGVTNAQKVFYIKCWLSFCFDKEAFDNAFTSDGLFEKAKLSTLKLIANIDADADEARKTFRTECEKLPSNPLPDGFSLFSEPDSDKQQAITLDSSIQFRLLSKLREKLLSDIATFLDPLNHPASLQVADELRAKLVAIRNLFKVIDENLDGGNDNLKQLLDDAAVTISQLAPDFIRLKKAITDFSATISSTLQVIPQLDVFKKMWKTVAPGALGILQSAEPILDRALAQLTAIVPINGLQAVMPRLRQAERLAEAGSYPRVGPWLNEVVEALDQFASDLSLKAEPETVKGLTTPPIDLDAISREPEMSSLEMSRFIQALQQAPSAESQDGQLQGGVINELAVQLAGEFNPRLAGMVYNAIENAKPLRRRRFQAIHVLRAKAGPFGRLAPYQVQRINGAIQTLGEWLLAVPLVPTIPADGTAAAPTPNPSPHIPQHKPNVILLDGLYDKVTPGSFVIIERTAGEAGDIDNPLVARVDAVATVTAQGYGLGSMNVTQLTLDRPWISIEPTDLLSKIRNIVVYLQSEPLELAGEPYDADIGPLSSHDEANAKIIELDEVIPGLKSGQWIVVAGERTDVPGTTGIMGSELALIADVQQVGDAPNTSGQGRSHTVLILTQPLTYSYQRQTVSIYANVVKADHGETKAEVIGSGDARIPGQAFDLKQRPLTHLSAPTASGAESTLKVRVNGVLWHPAERGAELGPNDRQFETQIDADDKVTVYFNGARLPSGTDNLRAEYRIGTGIAGNLSSGKITQLLSRPLGVKEVLNPVAAVGGTDRESTDHARKNAPLGVTALDRLVSISDYADFARAYAGVEKSYATRISDGTVQRVHVTVAGQNGEELPANSDLFHNLLLSMRKYGDPLLPLALANRRLRLIVFVASITVDPDYEFNVVRAAARQRVLERFGFEQREFGQDVILSELVSTIRDTKGILGVIVDGFGTVDERDAKGAYKSLEEIVNDLSAIANPGNPDSPESAVTPGATKSPDDPSNPKPKSEPIPQRIQISRTKRVGNSIQPAEIAFFSQRLQQTLILNEAL